VNRSNDIAVLFRLPLVKNESMGESKERKKRVKSGRKMCCFLLNMHITSNRKQDQAIDCTILATMLLQWLILLRHIRYIVEITLTPHSALTNQADFFSFLYSNFEAATTQKTIDFRRGFSRAPHSPNPSRRACVINTFFADLNVSNTKGGRRTA
jgi:hypothetical protein